MCSTERSWLGGDGRGTTSIAAGAAGAGLGVSASGTGTRGATAARFVNRDGARGRFSAKMNAWSPAPRRSVSRNAASLANVLVSGGVSTGCGLSRLASSSSSASVLRSPSSTGSDMSRPPEILDLFLQFANPPPQKPVDAGADLLRGPLDSLAVALEPNERTRHPLTSRFLQAVPLPQLH